VETQNLRLETQKFVMTEIRILEKGALLLVLLNLVGSALRSQMLYLFAIGNVQITKRRHLTGSNVTMETLPQEMVAHLLARLNLSMNVQLLKTSTQLAIKSVEIPKKKVHDPKLVMTEMELIMTDVQAHAKLKLPGNVLEQRML